MTAAGIARGGKLVWDGEVLRFGNHGLDRAIAGETEWSTTLAAISDVDVTKASFAPKAIFSGGMRAQLRIVANGQERRFVVGGAAELADRIRQAATQAQ